LLLLCFLTDATEPFGLLACALGFAVGSVITHHQQQK